jgi:orotate phosphoribosyltransferase
MTVDLEHQIMDQDYKKELLDILYARSFKYDPEKGFTLTSGQKSDVYIDVKKTAMSAEAMELIGFTYFRELKLEPIDAIGGITLGADPIAYAAALVSTMNGKYLDAFVIRKEPKKHGTMQWIEGNVKPDAWVCIVEDVVTTGESTIKAVERAREAGLQVRRVLALVDREEGGAENIKEKAKVRFDAIFTKSDLMELYKKHQPKKEEKKVVEKPIF